MMEALNHPLFRGQKRKNHPPFVEDFALMLWLFFFFNYVYTNQVKEQNFLFVCPACNVQNTHAVTGPANVK